MTTNDPRRFVVRNNASCPGQSKASANASGRKKGFLDSLLKVGDLEALNDIGLGNVGKGLRTLSSVADAVRVGSSVVPGRENDETYNTLLGKVVGTVTDKANTVLDTMELGGVTDAVKNFNPAVANRAYGQAEAIYDRVKSGNFELSDIPEYFQDFQNLEILGRGIFGGGKPPESRREMCGATPYARDLIAYAPKFKFLFIVEIIPAPKYREWQDMMSEMAFVVKTATRPRFEVEYEDVNMYNFRTRVAKRVEYPSITMSFYDDNKNAAADFYTAYMRAMSPIANIKTTDPQSGNYEQSGMNFGRAPSAATFDSTSPATGGHSASLGPLVGKTTSIISELRLHHVFDYGNKMNTYHFYNPRITTFTPSDLSQLETGEGTDFEFEFLYDGLYIDHNHNLEEDVNRLKGLTDRWGIRPINPVYAESDSGAAAANGKPTAQNQEDNAPSSSFLDEANSVIGGITDAFGNVIGGVTDAANGLIDGVTGQIGSLIPTDFRKYGTDALAGARNVVAGAVDGATGAMNGLNNMTSGLTGAANQGIRAAQQSIGGLGNTVSNAFSSAKSFGGSFFS